MKISFDIECEPEEVRRLMGLPDVSPMNEALVDRLKTRVEKGFSPEDLDGLVRSMITGAGAGVSELQKMLWAGMKSATSRKDSKGGAGED